MPTIIAADAAVCLPDTRDVRRGSFTSSTRLITSWMTAIPLLCPLLAGCATSSAPFPAAQVEVAALPDTEVRRIVLASRARAWKDPDSIVGAQIGDALQCRVHGMNATTNAPGSTCVCIELNARNSYGGYVGLKREVFAVTRDGLSAIDYGTVGPSADLCPNMRPFPELNGPTVRPSKKR